MGNQFVNPNVIFQVYVRPTLTQRNALKSFRIISWINTYIYHTKCNAGIQNRDITTKYQKQKRLQNINRSLCQLK